MFKGSRFPGLYLFRGRSDQTVGPLVPFIIENGPPWVILVMSDLDGPSEQYSPFSPLVSMVKNTDGPTVGGTNTMTPDHLFFTDVFGYLNVHYGEGLLKYC